MNAKRRPRSSPEKRVAWDLESEDGCNVQDRNESYEVKDLNDQSLLYSDMEDDETSEQLFELVRVNNWYEVKLLVDPALLNTA